MLELPKALSRLISLHVEPSSHIDNEYSRAGILDPKIVVTTSRDPSSKLLQFAKVCLLYVSDPLPIPIVLPRCRKCV